MNPITDRRNIFKLYEMTNGFKDFQNLITPIDYLGLADTCASDMQYQGFRWKKNDLFGKAFGEPFANFFIIKFGGDFGLSFDRIATTSEDVEKATDSFSVPIDQRIMSDVIRNSIKTRNVDKKTKRVYQQIDSKDLGTLGWQLAKDAKSSVSSVPLLICPGATATYKVQNDLDDLNGLCIDHHMICNRWGQSNVLFNEFADMCMDTYNYWKQKQVDARAEADEIRNRPMDATDKKDLFTLQQHNGGFFIAPPGWGKTHIQGRLIESWIVENPGPVFYLSRVKELLNQCITDLVCNIRDADGNFIERILFTSDKDHDMDICDPLAVGTDKDVLDLITECYKKNTNVIVGAVTYGEALGALNLLKHCLNNNLPVRVVVDEALEIIDNSSTGEPQEENWNLLLDTLRKLASKGLLEKAFGFDAIWSPGPMGMNDKSIWSNEKPLVEHDFLEGVQTNRLSPVHLTWLKIKEADLLQLRVDYPSLKNYTDKQCIEICGYIKMIELEKTKMAHGINATAKKMIFPSSVPVGREAVKILQEKCKLEVAAMISADTSQEDRKMIKSDFDKCQTGVIASYSITAKGFDIADTTGVQIGYGRMPEEGLTVHMAGRSSRRARGERGLPLEECVKKTRGTFYIATLEKEDGTIDPHAKVLKNIYDTLVSQGIYTIKQSLVSKSDGESKERKTKSPFLVGNEVDIAAPNELVDIIFEEDYTPDYIKDFGQHKAKEELQEKSINDIVDLLLEND